MYLNTFSWSSLENKSIFITYTLLIDILLSFLPFPLELFNFNTNQDSNQLSHICHPNTQEAEEGGWLQIGGQPDL